MEGRKEETTTTTRGENECAQNMQKPCEHSALVTTTTMPDVYLRVWAIDIDATLPLGEMSFALQTCIAIYFHIHFKGCIRPAPFLPSDTQLYRHLVSVTQRYNLVRMRREKTKKRSRHQSLR